MNTKQGERCIFCGRKTVDQHITSIGMVYIHLECLGDLEKILSTDQIGQDPLHEPNTPKLDI
jgi:hypothetical protein